MSEWQAEWDHISVDAYDDDVAVSASARAVYGDRDEFAGTPVDEPFAEPIIWLDDFVE